MENDDRGRHVTSSTGISKTGAKGKTKKRWILSVTPSMRRAISRNLAYATGAKTETLRIRMRDIVVFYVLGTGRFDGIYEADTQWHDPAGRWPRRVTDEIGLLNLRAGTAKVRSMAASLQFVKKSRWVGLHLHAGIGNYGRPISAKDCSIISERMQEIQDTLCGP